jgi:hypothetical protein
MILFLWRLIFGKPQVPTCEHKFVVIKEMEIVRNRVVYTERTGYVYVSRCIKCGSLEHHTVRL